ncbi:hypothetical protein Rsub_07465 [Raphidocelis subcapitata]|uniref:CBS domain-containing protein n=1 Tax=Raphidocelis subcapitata TaxID=307507 RepID=A0A2V0P516_9CHLO|nr:hypothetical protein Rsub_07465 [Raphidocelis subcapitata]|eukprot:GBF94964.1 hypothetical protein Rsub_07465 [Raphidocelis subcapitata]
MAKLLEDTTLDDIRTKQSITALKETASVEQALKARGRMQFAVLASKRVLSAPVKLAHATPDGSGATIFGFVDVRDIVSSFFQLELRGVDLKGMKMLQRMRVLEEKGQAFAPLALKDLPIIGGDGDFYHLEQGTVPLSEVVLHGLLAPPLRGDPAGGGDGSGNGAGNGGAALDAGGDAVMTPAPPARSGSGVSVGSAGGGPTTRLSPALRPVCSLKSRARPVAVVHRLALYDDAEAIVNIISQTDIVRFLAINRSHLGPIARKTVQELGWCPKQVVAVTPDVSAIEAMALMNDSHISAVAVVDSVGKIIGNFSVSEMRTIMAEHFGALALPVGEFLALEHGTEFVGYRRITDDGVRSTPGHRFVTDRVARTRPRTPGEEVGQSLVLVGPNATFADVVERIVSHRIHRVYVIDDEERPVGCATCTDVLRAVIAAHAAAR